MSTTKEKKFYEELRNSFIAYERNSKLYRDENLDAIIRFSRKYGCKQMMRYAAMTEDSFSSMSGSKEAREIKDRLTQFIRDYYETGLLLSTIYGSIKLMNVAQAKGHYESTILESVGSCMDFYLTYDGMKDSDIISIISTIREKGILQCLQALRLNYTSSGFMELKELFFKIDDKYLPILEVVNSLNCFLGCCPIEELGA